MTDWEDHYPVARAAARDRKRAKRRSRLKGYARSSMPAISDGTLKQMKRDFVSDVAKKLKGDR